ncbi:MAG: nitroreductase, partial [Nitrospirae bacterium]
MDRIKLPEPFYESSVSIERAIYKRRSIRRYKSSPLDIRELSQLLWSAQGITDVRGYRAAPSAGALYPLKTHVLSGDVKGLSSGIY